jgi:hypothetical protein
MVDAATKDSRANAVMSAFITSSWVLRFALHRLG